MPQAVKKNPQRTKEWAYRWILTHEATWAKVERLARKQQADPANRLRRIKVNGVASEIFEKAVAKIRV